MSKNYIENIEYLENGGYIPNDFSSNTDKFQLFCTLSILFHIALVALIFLVSFVCKLLGINLSLVPKPDLKRDDIVFVLTENEKPPINKKTAYRSDKNSQAGGIHDPNRMVSLPTPAPKAPVSAKIPTQVQQKPVEQPKKPIQKEVVQPKQTVQKEVKKPVQTQIQKPAEKPVQKQPEKVVSKPSKINAPLQRPVLKPGVQAPKTQTPKVALNPQSPFRITTPSSNAPVGKGFSTAGGTSSTGGARGGSSSNGSTSSAYGGSMPTPQFSTTRLSNAGGSKTGTRGASGTGGKGIGSMGNPGPGNPKGAPGIDAIKSPQWGPYMRELESKIKRNWFPPKGDQSKRVVLLFTIGKRGDLLSVKVQKPSGSEANDQAAKRAVQQSAPFKPLPPEYQGQSIQIEFTFDYNVLGANYR